MASASVIISRRAHYISSIPVRPSGAVKGASSRMTQRFRLQPLLIMGLRRPAIHTPSLTLTHAVIYGLA